MADKRFYGVVAEELASGSVDSALMLKARALCEGREQTAQALYVRLRVRELQSAERRKSWSDAAPIIAGAWTGVVAWALLWLLLFTFVGGWEFNEAGLRWTLPNSWAGRFRESWTGYPSLIIALLVGAVRGASEAEAAAANGAVSEALADAPRDAEDEG